MMNANAWISRRAASLMTLGASALIGLGGCAPTNAPAVQAAAQPTSGFHIGAIEVDTAPLVAQVGNPTAGWAQAALPGALARAFAGHMAPGDTSGATLSVRIDSIYLGNGGPDSDRMRGEATLSGGGGAPRHISVQAKATYVPSPVDQTLVEQAMQGRVQALALSFAYRLKRKWGL
jgi:hypothetical protein